MNNDLMNKTYTAMTSVYHDAFWKAIRGSNLAYGDMAQAKISANGGTYLLPAKTASRFVAPPLQTGAPASLHKFA